ncbi:hypothetical protein HYX03_00160 [Candidatus Woesearchaeota archaeon]|nr:hypothetical protein [Candidatus Woesearchaeota archaeon]
MRNKKLTKNKIAKGLVSLLTIIILLSSILAGSIFYEDNITANVVKETSIDSKPPTISIKEVNGIRDLNQLNEGWYQIRHGYVSYLETFDSYVPLYIKVLNPEQQNGLLVVDENGNIEFVKDFEGLIEKETVENKNQEPAQNQITGEVIGLEKVSGFVLSTKCILYDKDIKQYEGACPGPETRHIRVITREDGSRVQLNYPGETNKNLNVYYAQPGKDFDLTRDYQDITKVPPVGSTGTSSSEPPKLNLLPTDTADDINRKVTEYPSLLQQWMNNRKAQVNLDPLKQAAIALANCYGKPCAQSAKDKYESVLSRIKLAQESPDWIVLTYTAPVSDDEKKLAKQIFIEGYNNPNLMQALAYDYYNYESNALLTQIILERGKNTEAYRALSSEQQAEINRHLQNNEIAKKTPGVIYVPDSLVFVNKEGFIVDISQNVATGGYTATPTKERYEGTLPGVTPAKSRFNEEQQASIKAQGLIPTSDGKIVDTLNNEYSTVLAYNPQTENLEERWIVDKNTAKPPAKINVEGKDIPLNPDKFKTVSGLAVYKDSSGKLYDQQGNEIKDDQRVTQSSKFGTIDTEIAYVVKEGQVDKEKPVSAKIGNTLVSVQYYSELVGYLKAAGNNPKTEGEFRPNSPLVIKNEKGDVVAQAYGFETENGKFKGTEIQTDLGIAKGTTIQSNYQKGVPLLIKTISEDGGVTIKEEKEWKEIEKKDSEGKVIGKEPTLVTKSWVKIEERVFVDYITRPNGITFKTMRTYELDKDGRQINDKYTELSTNALTGEPWSTKIIDGKDTYEINYFRGFEPVGFFERGIPMYKNGNPLTKEEFEQLKQTNPALYSKISDNTKLHDQYVSQQFFASAERVLTEFQGLSYIPTLFMDPDSLLQWRDSVDRIFATLYLGAEYWSSAICGNYLDGADRGIAYAETPQGLAQVGAHVEATRTEPLITPTGREFIYKITFNVRNGDYAKDPRAPEEMRINVVLKGERTAKVFRQNKIIKRGASFGRVGTSAIVKSSTAFYSQVCLTFDNIPFRWKLDNKELCNTIVVSSGAPAPLAKTTEPSTATTPSQGAEESEFEDF